MSGSVQPRLNLAKAWASDVQRRVPKSDPHETVAQLSTLKIRAGRFAERAIYGRSLAATITRSIWSCSSRMAVSALARCWATSGMP